MTAGAHSSQPSRRSARAPSDSGGLARRRRGRTSGGAWGASDVSGRAVMGSAPWIRWRPAAWCAARRACRGPPRTAGAGWSGWRWTPTGRRGLRPDAATLQGGQDLIGERVAAPDQPRVLVEARQGRRQTTIDCVAELVLAVAQAHDRVERLVLVPRV